MKLLGGTKNRTTKNENGENMPYLEITDVALIHCNVVNNLLKSPAHICFK